MTKITLEHVKAIEEWQCNPEVHQLTCGNNSLHKFLKVVVSHDYVFLACPNCNYTQDWVPDIVIESRKV